MAGEAVDAVQELKLAAVLDARDEQRRWEEEEEEEEEEMGELEESEEEEKVGLTSADTSPEAGSAGAGAGAGKRWVCGPRVEAVMRSKVARLVKPDMLLALQELQRQQQWRLAARVRKRVREVTHTIAARFPQQHDSHSSTLMFSPMSFPSLCSLPPLTMFSPSPHYVLSLPSLCSLPPLTMFSPSPHYVLSLPSLCSLPPLTMFSPSPHYVLSLPSLCSLPPPHSAFFSVFHLPHFPTPPCVRGSVFEHVRTEHWYKPDADLCARMINCLGLAGRITDAQALFRATQDEDGMPPCSPTYTALLAAHCRSGDHRSGREVLRRMREARAGPYDAAYMILIKTCEAQGDAGAAAELKQERDVVLAEWGQLGLPKPPRRSKKM
ncbi:unnamed protein product [Closterium sp. NIES-65]|nr:unnamed protein product [Closterium sp. NIES-65]